MRRYLTDIDPKDYIVHDVDVAIIGSGLAGLYTAYHLPDTLRCALFTKNKTEASSSSLAQGGIAAVTEKDDQFLYTIIWIRSPRARDCATRMPSG